MQIIITEQAREDLLQIGSYLMERNPDAAIQLMQTFREKFNLIANFPRLGRERNDILLGLRCLIVKDHLIFYQLGDDAIETLYVRHSAQDQSDLLRP